MRPMSSADISIFSSKISQFCHVKKYRYRSHFGTYFLILSNFFESLKILLINMVTVPMVSAKLPTPGLLEKKRLFEIKVMTSYLLTMT